jgi:hypothetical protein
MKYPSGPFAELGFYARVDRPSESLLTALVRAASAIGFELDGPVLVHRGDSVRDRPFAAITDYETGDAIVRTPQDLDSLDADPNVRILHVQLSRRRLPRRELAVAAVQSISAQAVATHEAHPVALWLDATRSGLAATGFELGLPKRAARRLIGEFDELIERVPFDYAAVTVEGTLPCPTDLALDPSLGSGIFEHFWLRTGLLREQQGELIRLYAAAGASAVSTDKGVRISCYNPAEPFVPIVPARVRLQLNAAAARAIAGDLTNASS